MTSRTELLSTTLKNNGYSITAARLGVFAALENSGPITMNQLVSKVDTSINRASVYRVIDLYEKLGIVQRLHIGWKYKLELSNEFQDHHHHLTCTSCGKITAFQEPEVLDDILANIAQSEQFTLKSHQLELQGICKECLLKT